MSTWPAPVTALALTPQQGPIALLNAANGDKVLTADDAQVYLTDILNCINIANQALGSVGNEARGLSGLVETIKLEARGEQVEEVAEVLAKVIGDIVTAVEDIVDDIKYLPVVVSFHPVARRARL